MAWRFRTLFFILLAEPLAGAQDTFRFCGSLFENCCFRECEADCMSGLRHLCLAWKQQRHRGRESAQDLEEVDHARLPIGRHSQVRGYCSRLVCLSFK